MAETKKEEVVEQTTQKEQPKVDNEVGKLKIKKSENKKTDKKPSMKKFKSGEINNITKVDLSKPKIEKEIKEIKENTPVEEIKENVVVEETPIVQEIKEEEKKEVKKEVEKVAEKIEKVIDQAEATGEPLPEGIKKLMNFMEETGGDLQDYVKLNRDTAKLDDQDVLHEYYKETKPHLNNEEINFLMNDKFEYDEESDEEKTIKRKKLALKEQVASARAHLDGQKSKYYKEIKAGSKLTPEQQKAIDFFNRYNKESEQANKTAEQQKSVFKQRTNEVFSNDFKGFEYEVGDKKFRFNVKDADNVKETQSDIGNFVKKFLDKDNSIQDAKGYHKGLYTAMNADSVAKHFYEQGKADAIKDSVAKDKNINVDPRQAHGEVEAGGLKFKVLGDNTADFKFKIKNKK